MSFFNSEIVRKEADEITTLQQEILKIIPNLPDLEKNDRISYLDKMIHLIEKQKIFFTRISLSDDPSAIELKEQFINAARMLGMMRTIDTNIDMNQIYNNFLDSMQELRQQTIDDII